VDVGFTPKNGHLETIAPCPVRAKSGLMRCSKAPYSIALLARASNGRLMSGLQLPADAAMASALFGLGPTAAMLRVSNSMRPAL